MATPMGLEPTTSAVTGRRSNQLNYRTMLSVKMYSSNKFDVVGVTGLEPVTLCL